MISYSRRLTDLATAAPDRPAITCGTESVTRAEFESLSNRMARSLQAKGVETGDMVTIALANSVGWFVATAACWKLGAIPQPVSSRLPAREFEAIIELARPKAVLGPEPLDVPPYLDDWPLPDAVSPAWKAPTSGGSTGRPKLIVSGDPSVIDPEQPSPLLFSDDGSFVMPGPMYHNGPIVWSCGALLKGNHVAVLPRFDAEATLAAVDEHRADVIYLVPTMMKRILRLSDDVRTKYDLSSLRWVWHLAEPCPAWLKQAWIDWLGPDRIIELYGGTEGQAATVITGGEWLEHRGSVGRPSHGQIVILDADGHELPPGSEGEIWMRSGREKPTYRYIGAEARSREGGWESLGDVGWVDEDGYLYLGDRMQDMVLCGGANIYPAEVESALQEHPAVRSVAVIGLPDDDLGNRLHAIVETEGEALDEQELRSFLQDRLVNYKIPRSFEFVDEALRDDAGKVRRAQLRAERVSGGGELSGC
ncbi:MAG TPA: AMP-binding protein [Acidimicrobiales bacterium]|nr:AMP-binding protein [Acidimicrobiales bacterium]